MKKWISTLLVMLLLVGSVSAAFTDEAQISDRYASAVTAMSEKGIISGFTDGSFQPKGTLTRAQAAKIICVMLGAENDVAGDTGFTDVPATHWAAKFISYCAQNGIVAGVGGGRFDPDGKLTGVAFGKMLLVAYGADAEKDGLTGNGWDTNTLKLLQQKNATEGVTVSLAEMTREEACQLAYHFVKEQPAGKTEPNAEQVKLQLYYWDMVNEQLSALVMYYGVNPLYMDATVCSVEEGVVQTWQDFFLKQAVSYYCTVAAINAKAKTEGFVLSEAMQEQYVKSSAETESIENLQEALEYSYGSGMTKELFLECLYEQLVCADYMERTMAGFTFTDEELSAYYDANMEDYILRGITKGEGEFVSALTQAEQVLEKWNANGKTEEAFAALAAEYTTDPGSQQTGGLYENVFAGQMVTAFNDWCFDKTRQAGDTGIVETEYGQHVMYFVKTNDDGTVNVRHILLQDFDPDAWKQTVKADCATEKMRSMVQPLADEYKLGVDVTEMTIPVPSRIKENYGT